MARDRVSRGALCSGQRRKTGRTAELMSIPRPKFAIPCNQRVNCPAFRVMQYVIELAPTYGGYGKRAIRVRIRGGSVRDDEIKCPPSVSQIASPGLLRILPEPFNSPRLPVVPRWNLDCNNDAKEHSAAANSNRHAVEPCMRTAAYESCRKLRIQNSFDRRSCDDPATEKMRAHSMPLRCSARPTVLQPSLP